MLWLNQIEAWLYSLADKIRLEWFVIIGAAVEEIIAPIPSPLVMTIAGSIAQVQDKQAAGLILLAVLGSGSKTLASWLVYVIADKAEDLVVGKWGKYLGVTSQEVERIGSYFGGGIKDIGLIFLARAIPIMPTAPVSLVCGVIKIDLRAYLTGTFFGIIGRNLIYLSIGYVGLSSAEALLHGMDDLESVVQIIFAVVAVTAVLLMYYRRRTEKDVLGLIKRTFKIK